MSVYLGKDQEEDVILKTFISFKEMELEEDEEIPVEEYEALVAKAKEEEEDETLISKIRQVKKMHFCMEVITEELIEFEEYKDLTQN